jgi:hypothetical protein
MWHGEILNVRIDELNRTVNDSLVGFCFIKDIDGWVDDGHENYHNMELHLSGNSNRSGFCVGKAYEARLILPKTAPMNVLYGKSKSHIYSRKSDITP